MASIRYLCFNLGKEEFSTELLYVKEVIGLPEITPVPQSPNYFLGIMNLRGQVISILDLRTKFSIKPDSSDETSVIILDLGEFNLGVVVDKVNSVVMLNDEDVNPTPSIDAGKQNPYLKGVSRKDEKLILLLDIKKALSLDDKMIIDKSLQKKAA